MLNQTLSFVWVFLLLAMTMLPYAMRQIVPIVHPKQHARELPVVHMLLALVPLLLAVEEAAAAAAVLRTVETMALKKTHKH